MKSSYDPRNSCYEIHHNLINATWALGCSISLSIQDSIMSIWDSSFLLRNLYPKEPLLACSSKHVLRTLRQVSTITSLSLWFFWFSTVDILDCTSSTRRIANLLLIILGVELLLSYSNSLRLSLHLRSPMVGWGSYHFSSLAQFSMVLHHGKCANFYCFLVSLVCYNTNYLRRKVPLWHPFVTSQFKCNLT